MSRQIMTLTVNGDLHEIVVSPRQTLLDVIRDQIGLKGTKDGCNTGSCGVCTVHNSAGEAILSCLTPALEWNGLSITTIEGLESHAGLDPLQDAFISFGAVQCGYCTPGVIMSAKAILNVTSQPTEDEINDGMAGVICRCTGHIKVKEAIRHTSARAGASHE